MSGFTDLCSETYPDGFGWSQAFDWSASNIEDMLLCSLEIVDFFPIALTIIYLTIGIVSKSLYFYIVGFVTLINGVIPFVSGGSLQLSYFYANLIFFASTQYHDIGFHLLVLLVLFGFMALYAREYIGDDSKTQIIWGFIVGYIESFAINYAIHNIVAPYAEFLCKHWAVRMFLDVEDDIRGKRTMDFEAADLQHYALQAI